MQSNGTRIVALLVALAAIVALFFAFRGGDDDGDSTTAVTTETAVTTTTDADEAEEPKQDQDPSVPVIEVVGGEPRGGVAELEFDKGDEIRFEVTSDAADEIHVHGYDVETEVGPDGPAKLEFPADLEGVFEVELHESGAQIAELTVNP